MTPDQPLAGQRALVTGAGRGIGAAICVELSRLGASLILAGRNAAAIVEQRDRLSGSHTAIVMDVTDDHRVETVFEQLGKESPPVSILVNNAGAAASSPFQVGDIDHWRQMLDVNLLGAVRCTQAALAGMHTAEFGRIVNIASTAGLKGYAYTAAYSAAKHAVIGLTRSLALELARNAITVNAVCPGFTDTSLLEDAVENITRQTGRSTEDARRDLQRFNPQSRFIQPDEVARVVGWLCLPESSSLTGLAIPVAGGEVM